MHKQLFNPLEISICGYSGLGKTTMIRRLLQRLSKSFRLAYVKHDAHRFEMDKKGKDTYCASESGAESVAIYSQTMGRMGILGQTDKTTLASCFFDFDMVLIEGLKGVQSLPKIVFLDSEAAILKELEESDVLLTVSPDQRDDIDRVMRSIMSYFETMMAKRPLYGLVLTGGRSRRMGQDKAFLSYTKKPQYLEAIDLLKPVCDSVFLSCRADQVSLYDKAVSTITDQFLGMGPLGGILSAQKAYPMASFLVLACDLPYLNLDVIQHLLRMRNRYKLASAYKSSSDGLPEPLCAIYEPKSYALSLKSLAQGVTCPRKVLLTYDAALLEPIQSGALTNVNTPDECNAVLLS